MIRAILIISAFLLYPISAYGAQCWDDTFENASLTICSATLENDDLRIFSNAKNGKPFGHFSNLKNELASENYELEFAINGGMFHSNFNPVGLFIENGIEKKRIVTSAGPGNFGLLPNGIFCISNENFTIYETIQYVKKQPKCTYATQSGPLLVFEKALHHRLLPYGTSKFIRNGVGTKNDGKTVYFIKTETAVNLHTFARIFRDKLNLDNALYLDGKVSRLYSKSLGRSDFGWPIGPIIAVVRQIQ